MYYGYATNIISQSKEMQEEFTSAIKNNSCNWQVIPNPIDFDTMQQNLLINENPLDSSKINYVYVGRIDPIKGLDALIVAFKNVIKAVPDAFLTLVGDTGKNPEYYAMLQELAKEHDIDRYVKFVGFQENPYKFISNASCFVLPSRLEGNPNVLHEAMWLKIPVVATDSVPIVSRIVTPDRGDVVKVDDVNALATAMINRVNIPVYESYDYKGGNMEFYNLFNRD